MEIEIGRGKKARRAYGFDEITIVPSRRTRNPDEVDVAWKLGPYRFELPLLAAPMDASVSPATAKAIGRMGGLAILDLEGVWTRHEDADAQLAALAELPEAEAAVRLRELHAAPVRPELIRERIRDIKSEPGVVVAGALTPQRVRRHYEVALDAGLDVLAIVGTVVSAEHVAKDGGDPDHEVLNLKEFIAEMPIPVVVGGCSSYHTGLHLMRTGAAGVLVGVGAGAGSSVRQVLGVGLPQATAISDVAGARSTHVLETGEYVQVIAGGGMRTGGDLAKAIACGADALMLGAPLARAAEAPGRGWHWAHTAAHRELPRGNRVRVGTVGSLEQVLLGPAEDGAGTTNLIGALKRSMAVCGTLDLAEFNRAEIAVAPAANDPIA
ncbi:GuaB3 family IMP dehydrogenase-related protein [Patulibacter sp. SYSU D01012]|uniref:GuaB3 family IMP dehydrogenase-related protein n=1 Tax=Patulibacter sp. SYSU D01012 TaxID=2817381 RepID=UPI001B3006D4|nr:GuaB3 family IMP dehydrogenase-related protein [Patulibacter sp. SYSU D01012]